MKLNWGTYIVIGFSAFVCLMVAMVVISFNQNIDLVTPEYYKEELAYEERIQESLNSSRLEEKIEITHLEDRLQIKFPMAVAKGRIHFYKPNEARHDRIYKVSDQAVLIEKKDLFPGVYRIKIQWEAEGSSYYTEKRINI